jgi:hypothetical protein
VAPFAEKNLYNTFVLIGKGDSIEIPITTEASGKTDLQGRFGAIVPISEALLTNRYA